MGVLQGLVSHGGYLYAAWKGQPDDDRIFYSRWKSGGTWAPASPMASPTVGGNTSAGPSLGEFNGSLYAAWKGEWSDPRLFIAKFNNSNWENQVQIPNAYSDVGPALCAFSNSQLVVAWKTIDQSLYYAVYDGSHWTTPPSPIPRTASSVGPSLVTYGGKVYAVWKGEGNDQSLWYAHFDGTKWAGDTSGSHQTQISGVGSSVGASLANVGGKLYAVWKGEGSDQSLWYAHYDGNWSGQTQISGAVSSSVGAAIAELNGNLYAMAKGKDADTSLYFGEFVNNGFPGWSAAIPGNTGPDTNTTPVPLPGPIGGLPGSANYWFIDSGLTGKHLANPSVTLLVAADIVPSSTQTGGTTQYQNYSLQMNCWTPSPPPAPSTVYAVQQFGFRVASNLLFFWVNAFDSKNVTLINWDSRYPPKSSWPLINNTLPQGWQITVSLATDATSGHVTGVSFTVVDNHNAPLIATPTLALTSLISSSGSVPSAGNEAKIDSFMPVLVGENASATTNFASGRGVFLVAAANNLAASNTATAHDSGLDTQENSNVTYESLPASYPNGEFFQFFGTPSL
jgi:hypothetical protein